VLVLAKTIDEFGQLRAHTSLHVLSVDDAGKAAIGKLIAADRANIQTEIKQYEELVGNAVEARQLDELRAATKAYFGSVSKTSSSRR